MQPIYLLFPRELSHIHFIIGCHWWQRGPKEASKKKKSDSNNFHRQLQVIQCGFCFVTWLALYFSPVLFFLTIFVTVFAMRCVCMSILWIFPSWCAIYFAQVSVFICFIVALPFFGPNDLMQPMHFSHYSMGICSAFSVFVCICVWLSNYSVMCRLLSYRLVVALQRRLFFL